jgi:trimeric autotransporter adhesin
MKKSYGFKLLPLFIFLVAHTTEAMAQWQSIGGTGANGYVECFYIDSINNHLYVGGQFYTMAGVTVNKIAKFDGSTWSTLGNGVSQKFGDVVERIFNFNGELIIGGRFDSIGNMRVNGVARWDGSQWQPMGHGIMGIQNPYIHDFEVYHGMLYCTGTFDSVANARALNIARWNGMEWEPVDKGVYSNLIGGRAYDLKIINDQLVVCGEFGQMGSSGALCGNVAAWNDSSWNLFPYLWDRIYCMHTIDDTLVFSGEFQVFLPPYVGFMAYLDSGIWHQYGIPNPQNTFIVFSTVPYNGGYFLSGRFTEPYRNVCYYANGQFTPLDSGASGQVEAIAIFNSELYIGGSFGNASNVPNTFCMAKWNLVQGTAAYERSLLKLYPNPTTANLQVSMAPMPVENTALFIYNVLGQSCPIHYTKTNEGFSINVANLSPGFYTLQLSFGSQTIQSKFIKTQ